jgi:hypothetical protein
MTPNLSKIVLELPTSSLQVLYDDLASRKTALLDELDAVNRNLDALRQAITGTKTQKTLVVSEHDKFKSYMVSKQPDGVHTCTCPSFQFGNGLDIVGHCKHIRKVINEGRFV